MCTVPSTLTDDAGLAEEYGEEVAEGAERDEEVEAPDRTARAEDSFEEQAGGYLGRMLELRLRDLFVGLYVSVFLLRTPASNERVGRKGTPYQPQSMQCLPIDTE